MLSLVDGIAEPVIVRVKTYETPQEVPEQPPFTDAELDERGLSRETLPRHVACIMDGNGRWAEAQGLPRYEGHRVGADSVEEIVTLAARLGLDALTLYCFSRENWKRPEQERQLLFELLEWYVVDQRERIAKQNLRFRTIGRLVDFPEAIQNEIRITTELASKNTGTTLCLALNYGSRQEIAETAQMLAAEVAAGKRSLDSIDVETFSNSLDTAGLPDPDLVVRTAGEMRVSNFLLWQLSYAELYVTDVCWPEFREDQFFRALRAFTNRERRFGGLKT